MYLPICLKHKLCIKVYRNSQVCNKKGRAKNLQALNKNVALVNVQADDHYG